MSQPTKPLFSGVYNVSLKAANSVVPSYLGWLYLERPYVNQFFTYEGKTWVVVAFSGVPPVGQVLLYETKEQTNLTYKIPELCPSNKS